MVNHEARGADKADFVIKRVKIDLKNQVLYAKPLQTGQKIHEKNYEKSKKELGVKWKSTYDDLKRHFIFWKKINIKIFNFTYLMNH